MGRRPIGKTAMTGAERVRRYRLKHGAQKPVTKPARSVTGRPATKPVTKQAGPDLAALEKQLALAKQELALLKVRIAELEAFALQIAERAFGLLKPKRQK